MAEDIISADQLKQDLRSAKAHDQMDCNSKLLGDLTSLGHLSADQRARIFAALSDDEPGRAAKTFGTCEIHSTGGAAITANEAREMSTFYGARGIIDRELENRQQDVSEQQRAALAIAGLDTTVANAAKQEDHDTLILSNARIDGIKYSKEETDKLFRAQGSFQPMADLNSMKAEVRQVYDLLKQRGFEPYFKERFEYGNSIVSHWDLKARW